MSTPTRAYLSLGSNVGDRLANIVAAIRALERNAHVTDTHALLSPVYETAPIGADGSVVNDQSPFLNCAVAIASLIGPRELRAECARVERVLGREPGERWRPRPIDIDLVLYGDQQIASPELTVPHPRMLDREFVLRPLVDIDGSIAAPGRGRLARLLEGLPPQGCVLYMSADELRARIDAS